MAGDDSPIKVSPTLNAIFTAVFFGQILQVFYVLLQQPGSSIGYNTSPVEARSVAGLLLGAMVACFGVIAAVKAVSRGVGRVLSKHLFPNDPLSKRRTMHKFEDQMWQLAIHMSMSAVEFYILFVEDGVESWWDQYPALWMPHPLYGGQKNKLSIHVLYLLQLAIWVDTCLQHRFIEERHKDYFLMYTHHLVTIALVGVSYYYNYTRIGVIVLYLHDVSDIPVDLVKIFNYCQLEGARGLFLLEGMFVTNLITWFYYRFYLLFTYVIVAAILFGAREVGAAPNTPLEQMCFSKSNQFGLPPVEPAARGFPKGWKMGDGSFGAAALMANIEVLPMHPCIPLYWPMLALLCMLQIMHIIWYGMFWRIILRMITAKSDDLHDAGREVYEGESDEEGDDAKKKR